jgi:hypothetical protein
MMIFPRILKPILLSSFIVANISICGCSSSQESKSAALPGGPGDSSDAAAAAHKQLIATSRIYRDIPAQLSRTETCLKYLLDNIWNLGESDKQTLMQEFHKDIEESLKILNPNQNMNVDRNNHHRQHDDTGSSQQSLEEPAKDDDPVARMRRILSKLDEFIPVLVLNFESFIASAKGVRTQRGPRQLMFLMAICRCLSLAQQLGGNQQQSEQPSSSSSSLSLKNRNIFLRAASRILSKITGPNASDNNVQRHTILRIDYIETIQQVHLIMSLFFVRNCSYQWCKDTEFSISALVLDPRLSQIRSPDVINKIFLFDYNYRLSSTTPFASTFDVTKYWESQVSPLLHDALERS